MTLDKILSGVSPVSTGGARDMRVSGLALDSRKAAPGTVFFALPGAKTDGNRYVREAVEHGAIAVVSELKAPPAPMSLVRPGTRDKTIAWIQVKDIFEAMGRISSNFYADPSASLTIVGITGTNGKTTTAYFLESIFSRAGKTPGVLGTISHRLRHRTLEKARNTTPFSLDLNRLLARMRDEGGTHVAMEVSSHALSTGRVSEVHFDAAILTNFSSDHLDFHKTREAYFESKARLFSLLERADSAKRDHVAVLNRDDETFPKFRRRVLGVRIASFGFGSEADYGVAGAASTLEGTTFRLREHDVERAARISLTGRHNLSNALAAAACAREIGLPMEAVIEGLAAVEQVPGRLERVCAGQDFTVFVDYAHTESALASTLDALKDLPHRRLVSVFGCGGDRDKSKRAPMGAAACSRSDQVFATSDNPRGEDPMEILSQIEEGIRGGGFENYRIIPDRGEAIREAIRTAQTGDVVLIAGKGHEATQTAGGRTIPFDDRETVRAALKDCGRV